MGQMTDDIIDGFMCSHCGICFEEEHGYPVLCEDCHKEDKGQSDIPKATIEEL